MSEWDEPTEPPIWETELDTDARLDRLEALLDGMTRTDITGTDGQRHTIPAESQGRERVGDGAWSLVSVGPGKFSIEPGDIYTEAGFEEEPLEILGRGLSFEIVDKTKVWIDLDMTDPVAIKLTLKAGQEWPGFPKAIKMSSGETDKRIEHAYLKLWEFSSDQRKKRSEMQVTPDLIGRQFAKSPNSIIFWGSRNLNTRDWESVMAPVLMPLT